MIADFDDLPVLPPVRAELVNISHYYENSKGKLRYCYIADYPNDFTALLGWIRYRLCHGHKIFAYRTYLASKREHAIALKLHEDQPFAYISLANARIYVRASELKKLRKNNHLIRYITRYGGYKVKSKLMHD
ncbi:hypothetical protein DRH29_05035 [candidate division Kazan bacterium]|uniref:Uncharacterized protein n=1 Tax=candidate division Kazan bacterium TaxID=2202143 RepID=A0A420ZBD7_UNCK3|nr:MAG: hypothetical protein DRH29_05035 [candidate division Kazan bacterium]